MCYDGVMWSHEEVSTKHLVQRPGLAWRLVVAKMERQQLVSALAVVLIEVNGIASDVCSKVEFFQGFPFFCLRI